MALQFEELSLEKLEIFMLKFADERRTGQLKIQGEGARGGRVDFYGGRIVGVDSPFFAETVGEIAKKLGFLNLADVQKAVDALSRSENAGRQLADILLSEKLVTAPAMEACLRYQAESSIHSLIGFHGRISFLPGNVSPAEISLDVREVLRRMRERNHVEEMGSAFLGITADAPSGTNGEPALLAGVDPLAPADPFLESVAAEEKRGAEAGLPEPEVQDALKQMLAQKISSSIAQRVIKEVAESSALLQAELDAQAAGAAAQLLADAEPELAAADLQPLEIAAPEPGGDRPRLARVVLDICRSGASSTDALLAYAVFFGKRAVLFASTSRGLKVAGSKTREGFEFRSKPDGILLPHEDANGAVARIMRERVPARGPYDFMDACDRALGDAVVMENKLLVRMKKG